MLWLLLMHTRLQSSLIAAFLSVPLLVLPGAAGKAGSNIPVASPADLAVLCSAWATADATLRLVTDLAAVANDGVEAASQLLTECQAKPVCEGSREREFFEASLTDARNQQSKAINLTAEIQKRREVLQRQIHQLQDALAPRGGTGPAAICNGDQANTAVQ